MLNRELHCECLLLTHVLSGRLYPTQAIELPDLGLFLKAKLCIELNPWLAKVLYLRFPEVESTVTTVGPFCE